MLRVLDDFAVGSGDAGLYGDGGLLFWPWLDFPVLTLPFYTKEPCHDAVNLTQGTPFFSLVGVAASTRSSFLCHFPTLI